MPLRSAVIRAPRPAAASPAILLLAMLLSSLLGGCGGYALRGRVVESGFPGAMVARADESSPEGEPITGALVRIYRDPDRPDRELVAQTRSGDGGRFTLDIDRFGTGWMDERWQVEVVRPGYASLQEMVTLPREPGSRRLVIMLRAGDSVDPATQREDPWSEYERFR